MLKLKLGSILYLAIARKLLPTSEVLVTTLLAITLLSFKLPIVEFVFIFKLHCNRVGAFRILDSSLVRTFITVDPHENKYKLVPPI